MGEWLYLIIGIAVVGVVTLAGLLTSGRRRKGDLPAAGGTDVIAPPPTDAAWAAAEVWFLGVGNSGRLPAVPDTACRDHRLRYSDIARAAWSPDVDEVWPGSHPPPPTALSYMIRTLPVHVTV